MKVNILTSRFTAPDAQQASMLMKTTLFAVAEVEKIKALLYCLIWMP